MRGSRAGTQREVLKGRRGGLREDADFSRVVSVAAGTMWRTEMLPLSSLTEREVIRRREQVSSQSVGHSGPGLLCRIR